MEALDTTKRPTQYVLDRWSTDHGLPVAGVKALARTPDGFLWLGTEEGLVRFDGVEFRSFDLHEQGFGDVNGLFVDRSGSLWLATAGGVVRWRGDRADPSVPPFPEGLRDHRTDTVAQDAAGAIWVGTGAGLYRLGDPASAVATTRTGLPHDHVQALLAARDGSLWVGTNGGLAHIAGGRVVHSFTTSTGLPHASVLALHEDAAGTMWIGTFAGLARLRDGAITVVPLRSDVARSPVNAFATDRDGSLWIGLYGAGLVRWRDRETDGLRTADGLPDDLVRQLLADDDDSLWIATDRGGLARIRDGVITTVGAREGLPDDRVRAVLESADGTIWVATHGGGLAALRGHAIKTITTKERLLSDMVFSLATDRRGTLWVGTYNGGLNAVSDGQVVPFAGDAFKRNQFVTAIHEDRSGALWFGTYGGGLKRLANGTVTSYGTADGLGSDHVWAISGDGGDGLWIGTRVGLSHWHDGRFDRLDARAGWPTAPVWSLHVSTDGTLWAGTEGGLYRILDGRPFRVPSHAGLFHDVVLGILEDDDGRLWMSSNKGLFRVARRELDELAAGRRTSVVSYAYGVGDGMRTAECNGSTQPSAWRAMDGRLWFATAKGVIVVDPREAKSVAAPARAVIEAATADARPLSAAAPGALPIADAGSRQFEFHYTAPVLRAPERVRFRYRVEPLETTWNDAGTRRTAYYTHLPPGRHRFRVMAGEDGARWSEDAAATFTFAVAPHFYQTWTFIGLCTLTAAAGAYAAHGYRLRHVVALERVRTRIASDLHDDLGSSLSQIAILSEVAHARAADNVGVAGPLERIAVLSREAIDAMADIVWAIDPQRDTSMHLTQRLRRVASELLPPRNIALAFDVADDGKVQLGADVRRHVYLVAKESLTNIVKHSGATAVRMTGTMDRTRLRLSIEDNGSGLIGPGAFDTSSGQGLRSMRRRAEAIGGTLNIESRPGAGTRVTLTVPLR